MPVDVRKIFLNKIISAKEEEAKKYEETSKGH